MDSLGISASRARHILEQARLKEEEEARRREHGAKIFDKKVREIEAKFAASRLEAAETKARDTAAENERRIAKVERERQRLADARRALIEARETARLGALRDLGWRRLCIAAARRAGALPFEPGLVIEFEFSNWVG